MLHPDIVDRLSDDEIAKLLNKPVITDGKCLEVLAQRGFGAEFSASAVAVDAKMLYEQFAEHPVNKGIGGNGKWGASFINKSFNYKLIDKNGSTEPLGTYASNSDRANRSDVNAVANAIVTTKKGARWAVFGHYLWNDIISLDKRNQIVHAVDYISNNAIPVILESPMQAVLLPRENDDKKVTSVSVINTTLGQTDILTLRIRRPVGNKFTFMSQKTNEVQLSYTKEGDDYRVSMPSVSAWSVGTVFIE